MGRLCQLATFERSAGAEGARNHRPPQQGIDHRSLVMRSLRHRHPNAGRPPGSASGARNRRCPLRPLPQHDIATTVTVNTVTPTTVAAQVMSRSSPYKIRLSVNERQILEGRSRKYTLPYRDVFRANVILLAVQGLRNDEIADRLNSRREVVSRWRKRFFEERLAGLEERDRAGRSPDPPPPELVGAVKGITSEFPAQLGLLLSRLYVPDIPAEVKSRSWPASKAQQSGSGYPRMPTRSPRVVEVESSLATPTLLSRPGSFSTSTPASSKAGGCEGEHVIGRREDLPKPVSGCHPTAPPKPGRPMLLEHEYDRSGSHAAWAVHRAKLVGRHEPKTSVEPFGRLIDQVMEREPYPGLELSAVWTAWVSSLACASELYGT